MSPRYAVIVVAYRRLGELDDALEAISKQTVGRAAMEICVINNGGCDHARERWRGRVDRWLDAEQNLGCAGGRHRGVESTRAPILVFIDDDGVPAPDFVEQLGAVLDRVPEAVAVRGRAVALNHPILTAMCPTYHRGPDVCEDLLTLEGASAIRRVVYEAAGGYDTSRSFHEGMELSGRLLEQRPDAKILYTPHAVLRHDYLQGWQHMLAKAKSLAAADDRLRQEPDPRLAAVMRRPIVYRDGRSRWQRLVGKPLHRAFRGLVAVYRARRVVTRMVGLS